MDFFPPSSFELLPQLDDLRLLRDLLFGVFQVLFLGLFDSIRGLFHDTLHPDFRKLLHCHVIRVLLRLLLPG